MDLSELRNEFAEAIESKKLTDQLLLKMEDISNHNALWIGYKASVYSLKARYAFNPYKKLNFLNLSKDYFLEAIRTDPENIEIRFLRFSIFHYLPGFLSDNGILEEDKNVIINQIKISETDDMIKKIIADFLIMSKRCSEEEERKLLLED